MTEHLLIIYLSSRPEIFAHNLLNLCLFVHKYTNINKRLMLVKITSILTLEKFPEDWITALTCFVCLFVGLQIHKYTDTQNYKLDVDAGEDDFDLNL